MYKSYINSLDLTKIIPFPDQPDQPTKTDQWGNLSTLWFTPNLDEILYWGYDWALAFAFAFALTLLLSYSYPGPVLVLPWSCPAPALLMKYCMGADMCKKKIAYSSGFACPPWGEGQEQGRSRVIPGQEQEQEPNHSSNTKFHPNWA